MLKQLDPALADGLDLLSDGMCDETPKKKQLQGSRECDKCGATAFRMLDDQAAMVCGACGHVLHDHVENVEQEYDDMP